ncbi:MAG: universal stress protein [Flammeovirgaceae bacterium]|nr:MAG: universal stress protein [Flammeovirgaceae bacterium]
MRSVFKRIGLAVAFSPRIEALLAEATRLKRLWGSELVLIHIGEKDESGSQRMSALVQQVGLQPDEVRVFWESGKPAKTILQVCKREGIDLLIAGALKKENVLQFYLGSIARKILRKADCSVLMLIEPSVEEKGFKNIVVNADDDSPYMMQALRLAFKIGMLEKATWLHIVRKLKLYGFLSAAEQYSEREYELNRNNLVQSEIEDVQQLISTIPHEGIKVNIKLVSGKSGFELTQFAQRKHADLLVIGGSPMRLSILDRVFPNDLEYIFSDLPCNMLIVHPGKEEAYE